MKNIRIHGQYLQADNADGNPVGLFIETSDRFQCMDCSSNSNCSSITHMNKSNKTSVKALWKKGGNVYDRQNIVFVYSVVKDYNTYWVKIKSSEILVV
jgi:hypothetical protein